MDRTLTAGEPILLMDAIQRMRRERRLAMVIFAVFTVVAMLVHWIGHTPTVHAPPPPAIEAVE